MWFLHFNCCPFHDHTKGESHQQKYWMPKIHDVKYDFDGYGHTNSIALIICSITKRRMYEFYAVQRMYTRTRCTILPLPLSCM